MTKQLKDAAQYPAQDAMALDDYYTRHVSAMTAEGLHSKSDIAAQLAWRDREIDALRSALAAPQPEQAEPVGEWRWVPVKPTEAMRSAAIYAYDQWGWSATAKMWGALLAAAPQPASGQDTIEMAGMESTIGHLSVMVDDLRTLLGRSMANAKQLHEAATPDDGPDMDAVIPAAAFTRFVDEDAALRYEVKNGPHDGMTQPASDPQPAPEVMLNGLTEAETSASMSVQGLTGVDASDAPKFNTTKAGRGEVARFFAEHLKRHDFRDYIQNALAADFACALAPTLYAVRTSVVRAEGGEA